MIRRDFCCKFYRFREFEIVLFLEVVIKENSFARVTNSKINNIFLAPVAIVVINKQSRLFQFNNLRLSQFELEKLIEQEVGKLK